MRVISEKHERGSALRKYRVDIFFGKLNHLRDRKHFHPEEDAVLGLITIIVNGGLLKGPRQHEAGDLLRPEVFYRAPTIHLEVVVGVVGLGSVDESVVKVALHWAKVRYRQLISQLSFELFT